MPGSKATQFTATGPATVGFQTQPPDVSTQFNVAVEVSGLSIGVKGTATAAEEISRPGIGGTGMQGNGSGVGYGVAGFGGNATPGTTDPDPSACAGVVGQGGMGPQTGGPGVAGIGGPSSGVGVFGQGGAPGPQGSAGGPGVKGMAGSATTAYDADGVQGFGSGTYSGVAGWGGSNSGTGVVGFGGGTGGPGVRGIAAGGPNTVPPPGAVVGVYGQGGGVGVYGQGSGTFGVGVQGAGGVGVQGTGHFGVLGMSGPDAGDTAVGAFGVPEGIGIFAGGGTAGFFAGDVNVFGGNLYVTGSKSAVVRFPDGSYRQLYCLESPESWFEDFGSGRLTDGRAQVRLDPDFAATVDTKGYHVFITEYDDNHGLFVTDRTHTGFEVRAKTSAREAEFSYRVVAKRKDAAPARLAKITSPAETLEQIKGRMAKRD